MFKQVECKFKSGDIDCIGTLYLPTASTDNKIPCVVLGHGFGGVRKMLAPFAQAFAAAGWAALTFDYRNFGDSGGVNRQVLSVNMQLDDWRAAIAYARSLPMVDQNHICIWGSSLGGGHVLSLAAEDHGLRAAISQVPHISGWAAFRAMGMVHSLRLIPFVIADLFSSLTQRRRYLLPLLGSPGTRAIMTGDDGTGYLTTAETLAPGTCLDVAAASVLSIALYFPGNKIKKIRCPILVIVANRDGTTPAKQSLAVARRADRAEVVQFDAGHFDVYLEPILSRSLARQIAFLQQQGPKI